MSTSQWVSSAYWDDDADGLNTYFEEELFSMSHGGWDPFLEVTIMVDLNGTLHLVDFLSSTVRWSSETKKQIYSAHHSKNCNFYLDFRPDNKLYICKDAPELSFKLLPNDLDDFIKNQPKEYFDGEILSCSSKTTEFLLDYVTGDTIYRFNSASAQNNLGKLDLLRHSPLRVYRVDHELTCYSLKTGELLWELMFSDFKARCLCDCGGNGDCDCYPPIWAIGAHQPGRLEYLLKKHRIYTFDDCFFGDEWFPENDEGDTKVMHVLTKKKKKNKKKKEKTRNTVNSKTTANTDEKMKEMNQTNNELFCRSQADSLLVPKKEIGKKMDNTIVFGDEWFQEKDKGDTKVINVKNKKNKTTQKSVNSKTTTNADEKLKEMNETDDELIYQSPADKLLVFKKVIGKGRDNTIIFAGKYHGIDVAVKLIDGKSTETEIQYLLELALNPNFVKLHLVKYDQNFTYLVFELCICNLYDLILLVNNKPVQVQLPTEVLKAIKALNTNDVMEKTRDIIKGIAELHAKGIIHGNINPHNVLMAKDFSFKISGMGDSKHEDDAGCRSKAIDRYSMGRLILFIASNGEHEFCDTNNGDMNILKDHEDLKLIEDYIEAHDITTTLLDRDACLRPEAARVYTHRLYWDSQECRTYFEYANEQLKPLRRKQIKPKIINDLESIKQDVFHGNWGKKINHKLLKEKNMFRISTGLKMYDCKSMCDFLLFIRNVCIHYPQGVGGDRDKFVTYIRSVYPKLLTEVYKVFDEYDWSGTNLSKYHMPS